MSQCEWILFAVIMLACALAWYAGLPLDREWKQLQEERKLRKK